MRAASKTAESDFKDRSRPVEAGLHLFGGGFQMRQSFFGVAGGGFRIFLLALGNRGFQMRDTFLRVRIGFRLFRRFGVLKASFGVSDKHVGVAHFAMLNGFFRVANGFGQVILSESKTRRYECCNAQAKRKCEYPAVHETHSWFAIPLSNVIGNGHPNDTPSRERVYSAGRAAIWPAYAGLAARRARNPKHSPFLRTMSTMKRLNWFEQENVAQRRVVADVPQRRQTLPDVITRAH